MINSVTYNMRWDAENNKYNTFIWWKTSSCIAAIYTYPVHISGILYHYIIIIHDRIIYNNFCQDMLIISR